MKFVACQGGADTSQGAFMSRWGALPARGAIFSNRDSIFLRLLFDATCLMSVSCLFWHLLSVRTLLCPCGRLHDPGAPGIGRQVVGVQTKRWGGRFFWWGGTCHPISIQSYAPVRTTPSCVYSRFRWNLVEGNLVLLWRHNFVTWPDLTIFFCQKLRKRRPISYGKFQRDTPNGVASSSEISCGVATTP